MSLVIISKDPGVPTIISNVFSHYLQRSRCAYQVLQCFCHYFQRSRCAYQCLLSLSNDFQVCLPAFSCVPINISICGYSTCAYHCVEIFIFLELKYFFVLSLNSPKFKIIFIFKNFLDCKRRQNFLVPEGQIVHGLISPYGLPNCRPNISKIWQKGSAEPRG